MAVELGMGDRHAGGREHDLQRSRAGDDVVVGPQGHGYGIVASGLAGCKIRLGNPSVRPRKRSTLRGDRAGEVRDSRTMEENEMGGLIPLGDASRRPTRIPVVTILIILVNVFVFVRELTGGEAFVTQWAAVPSEILSGHRWITILTAMFMH